ncbi:unnamed protein product, partial [Ectocarpus sp. 8 AP-2014]
MKASCAAAPLPFVFATGSAVCSKNFTRDGIKIQAGLNHTIHNKDSSALEPRTTIIHRADARARTKRKNKRAIQRFCSPSPPRIETKGCIFSLYNPSETKVITCVREHRLSLLCAAQKAQTDATEYTTARTTRSLENTYAFENTLAVINPLFCRKNNKDTI